MLDAKTNKLITEATDFTVGTFVQSLIMVGTVPEPKSQEDFDAIVARVSSVIDKESLFSVISEQISSGTIDEKILIESATEIDSLIAKIKEIEADIQTLLNEPTNKEFRTVLYAAIDSQLDKMSEAFAEEYIKTVEKEFGLQESVKTANGGES